MKVHSMPAHGVTQGIVNFLKQDNVFRNKGLSIYYGIPDVGLVESHRLIERWAGDLFFAMDAKRWLNVPYHDLQVFKGDFATYRFIDCAFAAVVVHLSDDKEFTA